MSKWLEIQLVSNQEISIKLLKAYAKEVSNTKRAGVVWTFKHKDPVKNLKQIAGKLSSLLYSDYNLIIFSCDNSNTSPDNGEAFQEYVYWLYLAVKDD